MTCLDLISIDRSTAAITTTEDEWDISLNLEMRQFYLIDRETKLIHTTITGKGGI